MLLWTWCTNFLLKPVFHSLGYATQNRIVESHDNPTLNFCNISGHLGLPWKVSCTSALLGRSGKLWLLTSSKTVAPNMSPVAQNGLGSEDSSCHFIHGIPFQINPSLSGSLFSLHHDEPRVGLTPSTQPGHAPAGGPLASRGHHSSSFLGWNTCRS